MARSCCAIGVALVCVATATGARAAVPGNAMVLNAGFAYSPGYGELIDEIYGDSSPSYGFPGLTHAGLGSRLILTDYLWFGSHLMGYWGWVATDADSFINLLVAGEVNLRVVSGRMDPSLYLEAAGSYAAAYSSSARFDLRSGGVGGSLAAGCVFSPGMGFEVAYLYLPVRVSDRGKHDWGGISVRFVGVL